jgi:uncharacterized protein
MNLKSFKAKAIRNKPKFARFLKKFDKKFIPNMLATQLQLDKQVWQEVDCLSCANCCKTMTPTYTPTDLKRIAGHLNMTVASFKDKWLMKDEDNGDWVNKSTPCQFLNLKDNKCSIYEVRPVDCSGFPHHTKKRFDNYNHVYEQNLDKCPATYNLVVKMEKWITTTYNW